jgi:serine/threonine protein kinase
MAKSKPEFRSAFGVYKAVKRMGEGGAGTVFEATDETGAHVAVKVLDPAKASKEKLKRFKNEILFGSTPRHENIVRVLDHGLVTLAGEESLFYVMPLYEATLRDLLKKGLGPPEALRLYSTLLDGIEAAHLLGVVHRDIKPENVLYDASRKALVVADFGIAHFEQEELYTLVETRADARLANFLYAAPEQRTRGQSVGKTADVYALGLMLNELFTGDVPQGTGYNQIANVQPEFAYLDGVVDAMIRHRSQERLGSVDAVKQRLIGERASYISRQKLDQLTKTVVPDTEVDDPLVRDPIRLVDFEVHDSGVRLRLSHPPNQQWIELYRHMPGVNFFMGNDFRKVPISNSTIELRSHNEQEYQQLINQTKAGIEATNNSYASLVRSQTQERIADERRRLQEATDAERRKQQLRGRLSL